MSVSSGEPGSPTSAVAEKGPHSTARQSPRSKRNESYCEVLRFSGRRWMRNSRNSWDIANRVKRTGRANLGLLLISVLSRNGHGTEFTLISRDQSSGCTSWWSLTRSLTGALGKTDNKRTKSKLEKRRGNHVFAAVIRCY